MSEPKRYDLVVVEIEDRPQNFWQVLFPEGGDMPCGIGDTIPEALINLAERLRDSATRTIDDEVERMLRKEKP